MPDQDDSDNGGEGKGGDRVPEAPVDGPLPASRPRESDERYARPAWMVDPAHPRNKLIRLVLEASYEAGAQHHLEPTNKKAGHIWRVLHALALQIAEEEVGVLRDMSQASQGAFTDSTRMLLVCAEAPTAGTSEFDGMPYWAIPTTDPYVAADEKGDSGQARQIELATSKIAEIMAAPKPGGADHIRRTLEGLTKMPWFVERITRYGGNIPTKQVLLHGIDQFMPHAFTRHSSKARGPVDVASELIKGLLKVCGVVDVDGGKRNLSGFLEGVKKRAERAKTSRKPAASGRSNKSRDT